jgi:hypothetical protein
VAGKDRSWGEPEHVNRTRRTEGVHEQWVYDGEYYLYLDNGVLRSIQGIGRPESAPAEVTPSVKHVPVVTAATPEPAVHHAVSTATPAPHEPNVVILTKPVSITVQYGVIGIRAGTKLPFISRMGDKVRVRYSDGADYEIPISATDLQ